MKIPINYIFGLCVAGACYAYKKYMHKKTLYRVIPNVYNDFNEISKDDKDIYLFSLTENTTCQDVVKFVEQTLISNPLPSTVIINVNYKKERSYENISTVFYFYQEFLRLKNTTINIVVCIDRIADCSTFILTCLGDLNIASSCALIDTDSQNLLESQLKFYKEQILEEQSEIDIDKFFSKRYQTAEDLVQLNMINYTSTCWNYLYKNYAKYKLHEFK